MHYSGILIMYCDYMVENVTDVQDENDIYSTTARWITITE